MTPGKSTCITILACIAIIAGASYAWRLHAKFQAIEKDRTRVTSQIAALKSRLQTAGADLEQAKQDYFGEQAATTSKDATAMRDTALARSIAMSETYREAHRKRMNDPEYQEHFYKGREYGLNRIYGVFFAREHLTPDQKTALMKALTQREMEQDDLRLALESHKLSDRDPIGLPIKEQTDAAFKQAVEAIIGPGGYAQFETYDRQYNIRQVMSRYAAGSALIGSPMTLEQTEQMVDFIAQNNPDFLSGKTVNSSQIDWAAVDEQARKIMTSEQFDLFTHANPLGGSLSRWVQKVNLTVDAIIAERKQTTAVEPPQ